MKQLWVGSWMAPGWGLVTRKSRTWLIFQSLSSSSRERRWAGNIVHNWLCLHEGSLHKSPKIIEFGELSGWWSHPNWRAPISNLSVILTLSNTGFLPASVICRRGSWISSRVLIWKIPRLHSCQGHSPFSHYLSCRLSLGSVSSFTSSDLMSCSCLCCGGF